MERSLSERITRRRFKEFLERLWLALFMVPRIARAQGCCFNVYIDCTTYYTPDCPGSGGFFAADDDYEPVCYAQGLGGCGAFCSLGCACCDYFQVTCTGLCCGMIEYY